MSEDFLVTYLSFAYTPNIMACTDVAKRLTREQLERWQYNTFGEGYFEEDDDGHLTPDGMTAAIDAICDDLSDVMDMIRGRSRQSATMSIGPYLVVIAGGMSDGDDPSDAYTALSRVAYLELDVLRDMGFEPIWHDSVNDAIIASFIK